MEKYRGIGGWYHGTGSYKNGCEMNMRNCDWLAVSGHKLQLNASSKIVIDPIVNLTMEGSYHGMPEWKDPGAFLAKVANEDITDVYDRLGKTQLLAPGLAVAIESAPGCVDESIARIVPLSCKHRTSSTRHTF